MFVTSRQIQQSLHAADVTVLQHTVGLGRLIWLIYMFSYLQQQDEGFSKRRGAR